MLLHRLWPLTGIQAGMHGDILAYTRHTCFSGIVRSLLPSYFQGTGFHSLGQGHVAKLVALRFLSDGRDRRNPNKSQVLVVSRIGFTHDFPTPYPSDYPRKSHTGNP